MQLNPRYGSTPVIELDGDPAAIAEPVIRQRQRFVEAMNDLTEEQWARPSRCDGWSVKDVATHLTGTNFFWEASIRSGIEGAPTRILAEFDPVATPAEMVAQTDQTVAEAMETFAASTLSLTTCLAELAPADWNAIAEAPPGHVSVSAVAHHALWDSWIHERDILLPLGESPEEESDEVIASLRYAAALGSALALNLGASEEGTFDISVSDPDAVFHVATGEAVVVKDGSASSDVQLTGRAVDLLEGLSFRAPLDQQMPLHVERALAGLGMAFDR